MFGVSLLRLLFRFDCFGLACLFIFWLFNFVNVMLLFVVLLGVCWYYLVGGKCLVF